MTESMFKRLGLVVIKAGTVIDNGEGQIELREFTPFNRIIRRNGVKCERKNSSATTVHCASFLSSRKKLIVELA
jgi:hypothetical protein